MRNTTGQNKSVTPCDTDCGYAAGLLTDDQRWERTNEDIVLPAGAYFVDIRNVGIEEIIVNGEPVSPNGEWHSTHQVNHVTGYQDFVGVVTIESQGQWYWVKRAYPSEGTGNVCGYATGVISERRIERTVPAIILPGAYFVDIRNVGIEEIIVNGERVSPNGEWHSKHQINNIGKVQDFVGQIDIKLPDGGTYWLKVAYPSGSDELLTGL